MHGRVRMLLYSSCLGPASCGSSLPLWEQPPIARLQAAATHLRHNTKSGLGLLGCWGLGLRGCRWGLGSCVLLVERLAPGL
jgi:hypothetical protein